MGLLGIILVGLVAGWLAGRLVRGGGFGVVGDIVVGIVGAVVGNFLLGGLGLHMGHGLIGRIVVATIGAVVFIVVLRVIKKA